jgi:hypothetical protein
MTIRFEPTEQISTAPVATRAPVAATAFKAFAQVEKFSEKQIVEQRKQKLISEKYMVEGDLAKTVQTNLQKALENPDINNGMKEFNVSMKSYGDVTFQKVSPSIQPLIRNTYLRYVTNAQIKLKDKAFQQAQNDKKFEFQKTITHLSNHMNNNANDGTKASVATAELDRANIHGMIKNAEQTGVLSPGAAASASLLNHQQFVENSIIGQYRSAKTTDQKKTFRKKFKNSTEYDKILDPRDKRIVLKQLDTIDLQHAAELGFTKSNYQSKANEQIERAYYGKSPNAQTIAQLAVVSPEKIEELKTKIQVNLTAYHSAQKLVNESPEQIKASIIEKDNTPFTNHFDSQVNQQTSKMLKENVKLINSDPVLAYKNSKVFQQATNNPAVINDSSKPDGKLNGREVLIKFQRLHGRSENQISVLTKQESASFVNTINSLPLGKHAQGIRELLDGVNNSDIWGQTTAVRNDVKSYLLRDLQRNGLKESTQYVYRMDRSDDPTVVAKINDAVIALNTDKTEYTKVLGTPVMKQINNEIDLNSRSNQYMQSTMSYDNNTKTMSKRKETASLIAAQLVTRGTDPKEAVDTAFKMMDTGVSYGSYNGWVFRHPSGMDSKRLQSSIRLLESKAKENKEDLVIPPHIQVNIPETYRKEHAPAILFTTSKAQTSTDSRSLQLVDASGSPIRTRQGKTFSIAFKDIQNPSSPVSHELDNFIRLEENEFMKGKKRYFSVKNILDTKTKTTSEVLAGERTKILGIEGDKVVLKQKIKGLIKRRTNQFAQAFGVK